MEYLEIYLLLFQGAYYLLSGLWPILNMRAFLIVTGPKTDLWLVKTVGALVVVIAAVLLFAAASGRVTPEVVLLAGGSAGVLAAVDILYVRKGRISPVYLLDAAVELVLVSLWVFLALIWRS